MIELLERLCILKGRCGSQNGCLTPFAGTRRREAKKKLTSFWGHYSEKLLIGTVTMNDHTFQGSRPKGAAKKSAFVGQHGEPCVHMRGMHNKQLAI